MSPRRNVLVAEDEWLVAAELEDHLRGSGWHAVELVRSVAAGLAALRARRPYLAVLDLQLADGRATSLAEALATAAVPFLVLTGYPCQGLTEPALRAAPCLAKPHSEAQLRAAIDRLLAT